MKFHPLRRSTMRFIILVACMSVILGFVVAVPTVTSATDLWVIIVRIVSPHPPNRIGANGKGGDNIISPGIWADAAATPGSISKVWNVRPVILYQSSGNALNDPVRIELMQGEKTLQTFDMKDKPLHRELSIKTDLKPGEAYKILQFLSSSGGPTDAGTQFVVMPYGQKRESIAVVLAKIDCEFAKDEAKRSIARIQVFVEAGLWSDALQEARASAKTDEEWKKLKAATIDQWEKAKKP